MIAIARFTFRLNVVFCFWADHVLTRPLCGDCSRFRQLKIWSN